jgi:hypothetical protein
MKGRLQVLVAKFRGLREKTRRSARARGHVVVDVQEALAARVSGSELGTFTAATSSVVAVP